MDVQPVSCRAGGIGGVAAVPLSSCAGTRGSPALLDRMAGTKAAPRLFPEDSSDRNAPAVKSRSRTLKGSGGEEDDPMQHKNISCSLSHLGTGGMLLALFGGTGLQCGSRALMELCP